MNLQEQLVAIGACSTAREWVADKSLATAWATVENVDWMLWLAFRALPRRRAVAVLLDAIEPVREHAPDASRQVLDDLRRWATGEDVDLERVRATATAAAYAARADAYDDAAGAATYAAAYAARTAADAADADAADAADAANAAYAARTAAEAAYYAADAYFDVYAYARQRQLVVLRAVPVDELAAGLAAVTMIFSEIGTMIET